jgi:hypothetical protein
MDEPIDHTLAPVPPEATATIAPLATDAGIVASNDVISVAENEKGKNGTKTQKGKSPNETQDYSKKPDPNDYKKAEFKGHGMDARKFVTNAVDENGNPVEFMHDERVDKDLYNTLFEIKQIVERTKSHDPAMTNMMKRINDLMGYTDDEGKVHEGRLEKKSKTNCSN